jgi:pimeloyl-ACP methyl ester carboxylesterase
MTVSAKDKQRASTSFGEIAHLTTGPANAPPVLFVHGIPTSGYLWRHVLRFLQGDFRCIAPDLMGLGDTEVDPRRTPFDMEAQAEMLAELMTVLGHERFAVVCHDQGGAAAQIMAVRFPQRLTALVLTDCVAYGNWPVPAVARLQALSRVPLLPELAIRSGLLELLETRTPLSAFRRGVFDAERLSDESIREYLRPLRSGRDGRARFRAFLLAGNPRYTEKVAPALRDLDVPTQILWAADDRYISPSWGKKLYEEIPGAESFELVPFCGHFWPEERPAEFASHMSRFLSNVLSRARDDSPERPVDSRSEQRRLRVLNRTGIPGRSA